MAATTVGTIDGYDVPDSSTQIAGANAERKCLQITNDGDAKVYIAVGTDAISGKGTFLVANGGSDELNWSNMNYGAVYAIVSEDAGTGVGHVSVSEW